ncbi:PAS domain-containing protein [Hydrogenophaga sp. PAMC20947]|uniref:PAS domain-containing protein n=1 Tax=Hydrogenophaga sp. PAMC20947 TaxID=2565558 RepID=UPI00109D9F1E|nr:PAS domain-containing protein [Hydrogenophaga sp. PAMC20947]QCB46256.1 PAS domain S-box protein [Hydrogenophaga sp. PAMC20947]
MVHPALSEGRNVSDTQQTSGAEPRHALPFEAVFHHSPVPSCLVRVADARVVAVNAAWERATGMLTPQVVGSKAHDVFPKDSAWDAMWLDTGRQLASAVAALPGIQTAKPLQVDVATIDGPQGLMRLLVIQGQRTPEGGTPHVAPEEATVSPQSTLALRQQVELHAEIEKLARVGHWTNAHSDQEVIWSPGLYAVAGMEPRTVISRQDGRSGLHPDDKARWLAGRAALDGSEMEYRWYRPDGELRWLRSRMGRTVVAGQAQVDFGVVQDITEERIAKDALARQRDFLRNIADRIPGVLYQARRAPDGTPSVSYLSGLANEVFELNPSEVIANQRLFFAHIHPEDLPGVLAAMDRSARALSTLQVSFRANLPKRGLRWIQVEASTAIEADGSVVWSGFLTDATDRLLATRAMERQHRMLQAVRQSQAVFIEVDDKRKAFEALLASLLNVTESAFGFIGEVLYDAQDQPFLRMQAISNIAWDEDSRRVFDGNGERPIEFHNLETLFGHALRSGEPVISNEPLIDERSGGLPPGHPPLGNFLAVPVALNGRLVAMVGLVNRAGGFDTAEVEFLQPLLGTVRELVMASRAHSERRRARLQFQATSALLSEKSAALQVTFDSINQGLIMVDAAGRVRFFNQRVLELLDLPESLYASQPLHADISQFQMDRGDFGPELSLLPPELQPHAMREEPTPPSRYIRKTLQGTVLEVLTRQLPDGGFVRTYTDVTSYFDTQEALREERQRLQWVLEATRPGIWEFNVETQVTQFSERWASMLGYTLSELQPTTVETWRDLVHPDDLPRAWNRVERHLKGELLFYECDLRMRHKNGQWLWVNDRGRVHRRDADGKALYMSGTLLDIHDRVTAQEEVHSLNTSLERRVAERTAQLERSMNDMEAISYSIAHDLRAPLRSVNGFAALISEEEGERLSASGRDMFERIGRSSRNMGQMITDMLEMLRVVRVDLDAVPVDVGKLALSVKEALAPGYPQAQIDVGLLPLVMGDSTLLRQVLVNLMDNALKYSRHQPQPQLTVGFDARQQAFYLSDNGMGFDMARAGKLFGLFQRLHAGSDVPGTGVGLAIVARIVERHGGRIWAEAAPGQGATFWWTLPLA